MKKQLAFLLLPFALNATLNSAFAAEEAIVVPKPYVTSVEEPAPALKPHLPESTGKKSLLYLRLGVSDSQPTGHVRAVPGIGGGYRQKSKHSAVDISGSYSRYDGRGASGERKQLYFYTFPRLNFLRYAEPTGNQSFYFGGGAAFGGLHNKQGNRFVGLIPNVSIGYEMNRKGSWGSFVQFDISQPAIAVQRSNGFPGPLAEVSVGAGF